MEPGLVVGGGRLDTLLDSPRIRYINHINPWIITIPRKYIVSMYPVLPFFRVR